MGDETGIYSFDDSFWTPERLALSRQIQAQVEAERRRRLVVTWAEGLEPNDEDDDDYGH